MAVELGDTVQDNISGLKGIAVAIVVWLHGCKRVIVQPQELKDGKPVETSSFDEPQLTIIKAAKEPVRRAVTGGPQDKIESSRNSI